jgi:hypothetical protein
MAQWLAACCCTTAKPLHHACLFLHSLPHAGFDPAFSMQVENKGLVSAKLYLTSLAPAVVLYQPPAPSDFNVTTHIELAGMPEFNMTCEVSGEAPFSLRDRLSPLMTMSPDDPSYDPAAWQLVLPAGASLTCNSTADAFSSLKPCSPGDLVFVVGGPWQQPQLSTLVVSAVERLLVALDATKCSAAAGKDYDGLARYESPKTASTCTCTCWLSAGVKTALLAKCCICIACITCISMALPMTLSLPCKLA